MAESKTLAERVFAVRQKLENIPKNGERFDARGNFQFSFATHDDVLDALIPLFAEEGVLVTSECKQHQIEWRTVVASKGERLVCVVTVVECITLRVPGTDQSETFNSPGTAMGEATALGVARSYAKKYGLLDYTMAQQGEEADLELGPEEPEERPRNEREEVRQPRSRSSRERPEEEPREPESEAFESVIPESWWRKAKAKFHNRGPALNSQLNRLYQTAEENGWSKEQVDTLVRTHLDVPTAKIPRGAPVEAVAMIFQEHQAP